MSFPEQPFLDEDKFISLSSGVVADQTVNCDNADKIGFEIQSAWDNKKYGKMKLSKSDQVKTICQCCAYLFCWK